MRTQVVAVLALVGIAVFVAAAVAATAAARASHGWRVRTLETPPGYGSCYASAINERTHIAGVCRRSGGTTSHAFLWVGGKPRYLGAFAPYELNERDDVVGVRELGQNRVAAVLWRRGRLLRLDGPSERLESGQLGIDVNDAGVAIVRSRWRGLVWDGGRVRDLDFAPFAINNRGQVAGTDVYRRQVLDSAGAPRVVWNMVGVLWQDGREIRFGRRGGGAHFAYTTEALAINEQGSIFGRTSEMHPIPNGDEISYTRDRGFRWRDGTMTSLGRFVPDYNNIHGWMTGSVYAETHPRPYLWHDGKIVAAFEEGAQVSALTDKGLVVGNTADGRVFAWRDGRRQLLPLLGGRSTAAQSANNRDQIVGTYRGKHGRIHAALWTPSGD